MRHHHRIRKGNKGHATRPLKQTKYVVVQEGRNRDAEEEKKTPILYHTSTTRTHPFFQHCVRQWRRRRRGGGSQHRGEHGTMATACTTAVVCVSSRAKPSRMFLRGGASSRTGFAKTDAPHGLATRARWACAALAYRFIITVLLAVAIKRTSACTACIVTLLARYI